MTNEFDNPRSDRERLEWLLAQVVLGVATDEHLDQLNQMLLADEHARRFACDYLAGEAVLQRHFELIDRVATLHRSAPGGKNTAPPTRLARRLPAHRNRSLGRRHLAWGGAIAACILLGFAIGEVRDTPPPPTDRSVAANTPIATDRVGTLFVGAPPPGRINPAVGGGDPIHVGDVIETDEKITYVRFACGADVFLMGPAELSVLSPMRAQLRKGRLTARVADSAHGFRIETPNSQVTDLGTEFGVSVDESGVTDTVVFSGKVAVEYGELPSHARRRDRPLRKRLRSQLLTEGIALRITQEGLAERIVSVTRSDYPFPGGLPIGNVNKVPVIRDVWDNLSTRDTSKAYQIVHGGFGEDAEAFVDRQYQWNGISARYGLPTMLRGGDYIMPFCDDKVQDRIQITVDVARPARLYVLFDNRLRIPDWLSNDFTDTGYEVAIDEDAFSIDRSWQTLGTGPGVSLDRTCSVWARDVPQPQPVVLGAIDPPSDWRVMYGVVAVPLDEARRTQTDPVTHHQPKIGSGLMHRGLLPEAAASSQIERAESYEQLTMGSPDRHDFAAADRGLVFKAETLHGRWMPHPDTTVLDDYVVPTLNDGLGARNHDDLERNFWYNGQGRFSIDLKQPTRLRSIRTYSWHWLDRSFQHFTVWGTRFDAMPPVDFENAADAEGWELVGIVNTDVLDPGGIHASELSAEEGMGPYRHLLWILEHADRSTFLSEIDIYEFAD